MSSQFDLNAFILDVTAQLEREAARSALTDLLVELLQVPAAGAAFRDDPEGTLAARGIAGTCAQDVRDARTSMINSGGVCADDDASPPGGTDAIAEMLYTVEHCTLLDRALAELLPLGRFATS
ncbi:hypothetical protein [Pseudonocardia sp. GCM10023141]|uniref:hypothetical protein n=1 Tax=Pseudonocardia sp. GCM10023141 TaxID=3252653 RepID=UPI003613096C